MTRQELWRYTKKISFWLTYMVLMGFNLCVLCELSLELYYEITNPIYWRNNFTMHPYVEVEIPTTFSHKLGYLTFFIPTLVAIVWGNYRLYTKQRGTLWILAWWGYVAIWNIVYIDILGMGEWCPGHNFP